jgi:hypothetical protein
MLVQLALVSGGLAGCGGREVRLGDGVAGLDGGGSDGGGICPHAQTKAAEVLWIGDSWIAMPGTQHARVRDLARAVGAMGPNDDYVVLATGAGTTMAVIADQYNTQEAGTTKVRVLIMDGGGWDTILAGGSDASVASAADAFKRHLARVASDGTVEHLIYFLYPELPTIPRVAALRPVMQQACAASTVPCHFLDLQPLWIGHPEYTDSASNIQASEAGATVIADEIWAIMQRSCIGQ